jgi:uncharacterized protein YjeT (DUF2065 family)
MSGIAIICIVFGVIAIIIRGPLVFAPEATKRVYRRVFSSRSALRIIGVIMILLGLAMVMVSRESSQDVAIIISLFGWLIMALAGPLTIVATSFVQRIAMASLDRISNTVARIFGIIAVVIGGLIVYLGFAVF